MGQQNSASATRRNANLRMLGAIGAHFIGRSRANPALIQLLKTPREIRIGFIFATRVKRDDAIVQIMIVKAHRLAEFRLRGLFLGRGEFVLQLGFIRRARFGSAVMRLIEQRLETGRRGGLPNHRAGTFMALE